MDSVRTYLNTTSFSIVLVEALSKPFIDASIRLAEFSIFLVTVLSPLSGLIIKQNDMTSFQSRHELEQSSSRLVERIVRRFISRANLRTRWQLEYCMVEMSVFTLCNTVFTHLSNRNMYNSVFELVKCYNYSIIILNCIGEIFLQLFIYIYKELLFVDKIISFI